MRIVFVSPTASGLFADTLDYTGGAEVQQLLLARALARRGHDCVFVVRRRPGLRDLPAGADGGAVRVLPADFPLSARSPLERIEGSRALWEALARAEADVLVQKGSGAITLEIALFARLAARPFVHVLANDDDWACRFYNTGRLRVVLHRLGTLDATLVAQTRHQREQVEARWACPARIIPEGIPVPPPADDAAREPAVLWAATLRWYKRPERLLDLAERLPDVTFWAAGGAWVGAGERDARAAESFRARAASLPNVRCLGLLPHGRLMEFQRRASAFVSTSLVEGFPQTFLEAWAAGTPVATLGVDPDEVICRHGLGFHTATDADLADAVRRLMGDAALRAQIGRRARAYVAAHHDLERTAEAYEALFRELCPRSPIPSPRSPVR